MRNAIEWSMQRDWTGDYIIRKRAAATITMLLGIFLFVMELFVWELDGNPGFALAILSVVMSIGGFAGLCVLNKGKVGQLMDGGELGSFILDFVLEIFFGA